MVPHLLEVHLLLMTITCHSSRTGNLLRMSLDLAALLHRIPTHLLLKTVADHTLRTKNLLQRGLSQIIPHLHPHMNLFPVISRRPFNRTLSLLITDLVRLLTHMLTRTLASRSRRAIELMRRKHPHSFKQMLIHPTLRIWEAEIHFKPQMMLSHFQDHEDHDHENVMASIP